MSLDCRKRVGLALGGGVARGLAHIGVLSVLERAGIPIDCVSGTSAGSIMGAVYCAGWSLDRIREKARRIRWHQLASPVRPSRGLTSGPLSQLFGARDDWLPPCVPVAPFRAW